MDTAWQAAFLESTADISPDATPQQSAERLRQLIRSKMLLLTDMADNPERFFLAHRLLSRMLVDGFGIRFTVQFNLFAGSILGLGGPSQVARLTELQEEATLGCFALTERGAGVNSGLVVNTTAEWDSSTGGFVINTPDEDARKFWISQGLTASAMVVVANLSVNGTSHGPHAFLMPLRDAESGALYPGVSVGDMGAKTIANDLDNAWISFDRVRIPHESLLDRFCTVQPEANGGRGGYVQRGDERMRIEVIGQRLLTGRMCIAQSALVLARTLFSNVQTYAAEKPVWQPVGAARLDQMPQLRQVFLDADASLSEIESFATTVEQRLCACLRTSAIPSDSLVEAIAVAKVEGVGRAIKACHALQQEVGSFALLGGSGFEHMDMLLCCKFAEGDERILMQKMARDRLVSVQQGRGGSGWLALGRELFMEAPQRREALKTLQLALAMKANTPASTFEHAVTIGADISHMAGRLGAADGTAMTVYWPSVGANPNSDHGSNETHVMASRMHHQQQQDGGGGDSPRAQPASAGSAESISEDQLSAVSDPKMAAKAGMVAAWTASWEEVYALAAAICARHVAQAKAGDGGGAEGSTYASIGQMVMPRARM
jgi:acyl-CoA oxidase